MTNRDKGNRGPDRPTIVILASMVSVCAGMLVYVALDWPEQSNVWDWAGAVIWTTLFGIYGGTGVAVIRRYRARR